MSYKSILAGLISAQLACLPLVAQAQSSDFDRAFAERGAEARFSLTIPLEESSKSSETAPRLDFGVRNYAPSNRFSTEWTLAEPDYREARLGFTLTDKPQFMLNDQALIPNQDDHANIGTAGKIGLGVAAVALTAVAVVGVLIVECDSRDCWDDDE